MNGLMEPRISPEESPKDVRYRVAFDSDPDTIRAIELRAIAMSAAARRRVSNSEAINVILREVLAKEIAEAKHLPPSDELPPQPKKPGRKRKSG